MVGRKCSFFIHQPKLHLLENQLVEECEFQQSLFIMMTDKSIRKLTHAKGLWLPKMFVTFTSLCYNFLYYIMNRDLISCLSIWSIPQSLGLFLFLPLTFCHCASITLCVWVLWPLKVTCRSIWTQNGSFP